MISVILWIIALVIQILVIALGGGLAIFGS
jgi:hypothetical protein